MLRHQLLSRGLHNQNKIVGLPSLIDKIRQLNLFTSLVRDNKNFQSSEFFRQEEIPITYLIQEKLTSTKFQQKKMIQQSWIKTICKRVSQKFEFKGKNRSTQDSIDSGFISPFKQKRKLTQRLASLMVLPNVGDMFKIFTLDIYELLEKNSSQSKQIHFRSISPQKKNSVKEISQQKSSIFTRMQQIVMISSRIDYILKQYFIFMLKT